MIDDKRLDRIEGKLDKLADAMESLARIDERMVTLFNRMDKYDSKHDILAEKVAKIEAQNVKQTGKVDWVEKFIWVLIVATVTILVNLGFIE
jgi:hypothetical protein